MEMVPSNEKPTRKAKKNEGKSEIHTESMLDHTFMWLRANVNVGYLRGFEQQSGILEIFLLHAKQG